SVEKAREIASGAIEDYTANQSLKCHPEETRVKLVASHLAYPLVKKAYDNISARVLDLSREPRIEQFLKKEAERRLGRGMFEESVVGLKEFQKFSKEPLAERAKKARDFYIDPIKSDIAKKLMPYVEKQLSPIFSSEKT